MKLFIFAVRDRATDQFVGSPMFLLSAGQAIRSFGDEVNNSESGMFAHPDDYDLYALGDFDTDSGEFSTKRPEQIAIGKMVKVRSESSPTQSPLRKVQ